jgi:peptidoglycan/xylan/chitin deacetylase (PgdA/CDA1 family)
MYFAIRDDDTSVFTAPEELENIYKNIYRIVPISLAVVPYSVQVYRDRLRFSNKYNDNDEVPIGTNNEIVDYLKEHLKEKKIEIMLHGYSHEYKKINNMWVGECKWKSYIELKQQLNAGKNYLEDLLNTNIKVFVPPSNQISSAGIKVIEEINLNLSGIIGRNIDRPISLKYLRNYIKRWSHRFLNKFTYPYILDYGKHKELVAYPLTPIVNYEYLEGILKYCKTKSAPFVLATHYNELNSFPELRNILYKIIDRALNMGYKPKLLNEIFMEDYSENLNS